MPYAKLTIMSPYISVFSLLTLVSIMVYLLWQNKWLLNGLVSAEREAAQKKSDLETSLKVREIERAVYEEKIKQLEATKEDKGNKEAAHLISASKERDTLNFVSDVVGKLLDFVSKVTS
jgi:predicted Holliday junction resolvase-like endonuclease